MDKTDISHR